MAFDGSQINDARANEIYRGLKEDGSLTTSMVSQLAQKVPSSGIPGHEGLIKRLDFQAISPTNNLSGYGSMDANGEEMATPVSNRAYKIQKIHKYKEWALGLEPDQLFQRIKESFVPHLKTQVEYEKDAELDTILSGAGTSGTNAQDVTVRDLSAGSNEQWSDATNSDPVGDLRSAVQDAKGDTIFLGRTKANNLLDHDDFQKLTGFANPGMTALANHLIDVTGADRVVIGNKIFQNGAISAAASLDYISADRAAVFNSANLLYLETEDMKFVTEDVELSNVRRLHGVHHGSLIVVDPLNFIVFDDVA